MENNRNLWVYDIETLTNLFTYTGYNIDSKEIVQFTIWENINELQSLVEHLNSTVGLIGFNNISFDYPVLHFILNNYNFWEGMSSELIIEMIYSTAQTVITDEWSAIKDKYVKIPQLDLFRIWHYNNKARMTSLKKLQIALRYPNVQDMPYKHYDKITNIGQVNEILDYNLNDVKSTYDFYLKTLEKLDLRRGLYQQYGIRCMNYPDSKIGEELTLKLYCDVTDKNINEVRKLRTKRRIFRFRECFPQYMYFKTSEFNGLINYLSSIEVNELKGSFKYSFEYNDFIFDLGTGGIHGCIKAGVYESDENNIIVDIDVASLYPSLAIVNGLYPEHLGSEFVQVYKEGIVDPRLKAKAEKNMVLANGFKLSANSVYGKSNSEFSWLYDPLYTLKTTLGGQLSLCMLSERLMTNVENLKMLQINTDGITVMIPVSEKRNFYNHCKEWEKETNLILEYVAYEKMIIRDVNNYISKDMNGKVKLKGTFVTYQQMLKEESFHKSLSQAIVAEALSKYFLDNIPVEQTILEHDNIYDFCKMFNASHGWTCETVKDDVISQQQKTNRYYISTDGSTFRKVKGERLIEIEAGEKLVTIFNEYEEKNILDYNIDYVYYIQECYKIIHKIDGTEERLIKEQKEQKEKERKSKEEEKFKKYCLDKIPTERQLLLYGKDWLLEKYGTPKTK